MKTILSIILWLLSLVAVLIFTFAIFIFISLIQVKLIVPDNYIMWIFKFPTAKLVFIYELYPMFIFFCLFNKDFRKSSISFLKRHRKIFFPVFGIFNVILLYVILTNVAVITKDKIIDYSFHSPQGNIYSFKDITTINTGLYGKKQFLGHSKGDFYYIIELKDGTTIDLAEDGGTMKDEDLRFILERLDKQFVHMGIPKKASMTNFNYTKKNLDKIYTDKIRNILENNP